MHLKWSNGSKQELHLYIDLQAVEAKKLISSTLELLHLGHFTILVGGEIPKFSSLSFVSCDIKSVVHGGNNCVLISKSI